MNSESVNKSCESKLSKKKIKIEFFDSSDIKHTISLDGEVSKDKISQVLDYIDLMGGTTHDIPAVMKKDISNKFDRVKKLVLSEFSDKIFNSKGVQSEYFKVYDERIPLSTVSTYLSRLVDKGFLSRGGSSGEWNYAFTYKGETIYR